MRLCITVAKLAAFMLGAIAVLVGTHLYLRDEQMMPKSFVKGLSYGLATSISAYCVIIILNYRLASKSWLEYYANFLWSPNRLTQNIAINVLSLAFGNRFGRSFWRKGHDRCCQYWKAWWLKNREKLEWDSELNSYVEDDILGKTK